MLKDDEKAALELLRAIDAGEIIATPRRPWEFVVCDHVLDVAGGGEVGIFMDCGDWDYVDGVVLPDGRVVEGFPGKGEKSPIADFRPRNPERFGLTAKEIGEAFDPDDDVIVFGEPPDEDGPEDLEDQFDRLLREGDDLEARKAQPR